MKKLNLLFVFTMLLILIACNQNQTAEYDLTRSYYLQSTSIFNEIREEKDSAYAEKLLITRIKQKGEIKFFLDLYSGGEQKTRLAVVEPNRIRIKMAENGDSIYSDGYTLENGFEINYALNHDILNAFEGNFDTLHIISILDMKGQFPSKMYYENYVIK